jgi:hypothetical protein
MSFMLTQFGHGETSTLRTVELALAVNQEMERRGKERYRILIPWTNGERQRRVLKAAFTNENTQHPEELLLDVRLGRILSMFVDLEIGYAASIALWVAGWEDAGRQVRAHFNQDVIVSDLDGTPVPIGQPNIALELNRAPRFHIGLSLAYQVATCRESQLFAAMAALPTGTFSLGHELIRGARHVAEEIERNLCRTYVSVPGLFSSPELLLADTLNNDLIPPTTPFPADESIAAPPSSVYVTVSNPPESDPVLRTALTWGVPIFTNDPGRLGGGQAASPGILKNPNVQFHFAAGGWESTSLSLRCEKPLVVPPFDLSTDPEIYFNNQKNVGWGLAQLERDNLDDVRSRLKTVNETLLRRFATLDGTTVAAQRIVDDLLK